MKTNTLHVAAQLFAELKNVKHRRLLLICTLIFPLTGFSQKLVKTYYDYQNTKIHEEYYVNANGEKDGKYTEYSQNGIVTGQATFHNGLANGTVIVYSTETGRQVLLKKETYVEGKKNGSATYYDDVNDASIVTSTGAYKDDAKEGSWTFIKPLTAQDYNYPNPEIPQQAWNGCNHIKYTEKYNNDEKLKVNGAFTQTFYPSGKVYLEGRYNNDTPVEVSIFYPNGKLFAYVKYDSTGYKLFGRQWQYPGGSKDSIQFYIKVASSQAHTQDSINNVQASQNFIKEKMEAEAYCGANHSYNAYHNALVDYTNILKNYKLASAVKDSINTIIVELNFFLNRYDKIGQNGDYNDKYNQFYTLYAGNNGSFNTYPHGSHLFEKTDKLLKQLFSEVNGQFVLADRYKKAILIMAILDKMIALSNTDTKDLDKQIKKAETPDEIKQVLGL
ncbi:MAG TPA: hypothetical protein VNY36_03105 [Bacteroidia bacterium]|jgi:antitoxin component YwqK of YwqJK toxin-antitoxin module|nr:hypothetical protein [Bacteroidia bacterium]